MFWYDTQFKNAEAARARNKREERKLQIEIERKNGMRAVHESQIEEVSKEQRRIKQELDRIRKSSEGPTSVLSKSLIYPRLGRAPRPPKRKKSRLEQSFQLLADEYDQEKIIPENGLMRAIMLIGCEVSKPENNAVLNKHTKTSYNKQTTSDDSSSSTHQQIVSSNDIIESNNSIKQGLDNLDRATSCIHTAENIFRQAISPEQRITSSEHTFMSTEDFSHEKIIEDDRLTQLKAISNYEPYISRSTGYVPKHRVKSLDLLELAGLDMKSVKSNVSRRLSGTTAPSTQSDLSKRRISEGNFNTTRLHSRALPGSKVFNERRESFGTISPKPLPSPTKEETTTNKVKELDDTTHERSSKKKAISKSKDHLVNLEIGTEEFDDDDSSRSSLYVSSDEAWDRARQARYLRTNNREQVERERELSVNEIFEK